MAKPSDHIEQWKHNRRFIEMIPRGYPDWIVTVAFYTALHAIDALLTFDNTPDVINHETRNRVLTRTHKYLKITRAYLPLYNLSRTVRYVAAPSKWIKVSDIETRVFRLLYGIEKSVQKLMGDIDLDLARLAVRSDEPSAPVPPT